MHINEFGFRVVFNHFCFVFVSFSFFLFFSLYHCRGSAIAKIVGANAARLDHFNERVTMYVYEELINGKKLTEIINETHENVKYLPGHKIPPNVVSLKWIDGRNQISLLQIFQQRKQVLHFSIINYNEMRHKKKQIKKKQQIKRNIKL